MINVACAGGAVIAGIVFATCIAAAPVTMGQSIGVAIGALGSLTITGLGTAFAFGS